MLDYCQLYSSSYIQDDSNLFRSLLSRALQLFRPTVLPVIAQIMIAVFDAPRVLYSDTCNNREEARVTTNTENLHDNERQKRNNRIERNIETISCTSSH